LKVLRGRWHGPVMRLHRKKMAMDRTGVLLLASLAIAQTGCAGGGSKTAIADPAYEGWACHQLEKAKEDTARRESQGGSFAGTHNDPGAAVGALVVGSILAGACLISRS